MYTIKNVLSQAPDKIKGGILLIGTAVIVTVTGADPVAILASWSVAIERTLEWFYVAPAVKAKAAGDLDQLQKAIAKK